jgi:ETFB lysine methyltransferase
MEAHDLIETQVLGQTWRLSRPADLESLWEAMCAASEGQPGTSCLPGLNGGDERLPYWVELWPAAVLLARWLCGQAALVRGRVCLDVGCGLGLSSLVAASVGARVLAFDYEPEALAYARRNIALNRELLAGREPLFALMDWRTPALAPGSVDVLVGADILYERRFFEPVAALLDYALAPGGVAWLADPERAVSSGVWERLGELGWRVSTPLTDKVAQGGQNMTVHLREIRRAERQGKGA